MILSFNQWKKAYGTVVVIDVLRAFTTSSIIFNNNPTLKTIILIKDAEIGLRTKETYPNAVLFGEKGGRKIKGFDYENSPAEMDNFKYCPETPLIFRTSSGTKSTLNLAKNDSITEMLAGSFTTAHALKKYLAVKTDVCYLITGSRTPDGGLEDVALAEYLRGNIDEASAKNMIVNCYSSLNWIKNKEDILYSIGYQLPFIQIVEKSNEPYYLVMSKRSIDL